MSDLTARGASDPRPNTAGNGAPPLRANLPAHP